MSSPRPSTSRTRRACVGSLQSLSSNSALWTYWLIMLLECRCVRLNYETELVHFKHGAADADPEVQGSTRIPPTALAWEQCVTTSQPGQPFSGRTMWIRNLQTPLREF